MDAGIQTELDKLTGLIIDAIPVEQIFLFGSYAYGTPHKDSDLDLYVVVKDDYPLRDLDAGLQISMAIARKKSMPVDIVAKKKKDFLNRLEDMTLERVVNRDGIRIFKVTVFHRKPVLPSGIVLDGSCRESVPPGFFWSKAFSP
jgi:predicted nucleotidyltransferase